MVLAISVPLVMVYVLDWDKLALSHALLSLFRIAFWALILFLCVFVAGKELLGFDSYRNKCFEKDIGKVMGAIYRDESISSAKISYIYLMMIGGFFSYVVAGFLMGHGVFYLIFERILKWGA